MTRLRVFILAGAAATLAACGGNEPKEVDCEASLKFQNRTIGKRVEAPEGLDQLNFLEEMPIPAADPNAPKMPAGVCNDMPPVIKATGA